MNGWKKAIVGNLRKLGYDLTRYRPSTHADSRRARLMEVQQIDLVLDVGANEGQYAMELREAGFRGRIVSFEPLSSAYAVLEKNAAGDPEWKVMNCALGEESGVSKINVAGNSTSSSLLGMLPAHEDAAPYSKYVGEQEIVIKTLDEIFDEVVGNHARIWLKIDTQGYEAKVIAGALKSLRKISVVQMEASLQPLYDGAPSTAELLTTMDAQGYSIVGMDPGFCDERHGHLLQVDITFLRRDA
ncbi:MAG: FkbM family methyltransferase [Luteolibacter sp.]